MATGCPAAGVGGERPEHLAVGAQWSARGIEGDLGRHKAVMPDGRKQPVRTHDPCCRWTALTPSHCEFAFCE